MKIVIDIPDGYVGVIMANQRMEGSAMDKLIRQAVIDGTPLPKGHGDIVDIETLIDMFWDGDYMEITKYDLPKIKPIIKADEDLGLIKQKDVPEEEHEER